MKNHETVREMTQGQLRDIAATLIESIPTLTFKEAQIVTGNKGKLIKGIRKAFKQQLDSYQQLHIDKTHARPYPITVNYAGDKTIKDYLKEGSYAHINKNITDKNFPVQENDIDTVEIYLTCFNRDYNGNQIIEELDKRDYKPVNPAQLLALGERYPDLQKQFPIVALGQYWFSSNVYSIVYLFNSPSVGRCVGLTCLEDKRSDDWRVAAVRK